MPKPVVFLFNNKQIGFTVMRNILKILGEYFKRRTVYICILLLFILLGGCFKIASLYYSSKSKIMTKRIKDLRYLIKLLRETKDYSRAFEHLERLQTEDHYWAPFLLGYMYYTGLHVVPNKEKVIHFLTLSEKAGNKYAKSILGMIWLLDLEIPKTEMGLKYLQDAASKGESFAAYNLAAFYSQELFGLPKDPKQALYWLKESSAGNNPLALFHLAGYYANGKIIEQDEKKALDYFFESAKCGNPYAYSMLYKIFQKGLLSQKHDVQRAVSYLEKAAILDNDWAKLMIRLQFLAQTENELAKFEINKVTKQGFSTLKYINTFLTESNENDIFSSASVSNTENIFWSPYRKSSNKYSLESSDGYRLPVYTTKFIADCIVLWKRNGNNVKSNAKRK